MAAVARFGRGGCNVETQEKTRLPIAEIEAHYPAHFILIDEPEIDEENKVVSGFVLFAETDKNEVYRKAAGMTFRNVALHRTKKNLNKKCIPWFAVSTPVTTSSLSKPS